MFPVPADVTTGERARWLGELSDALAEAQDIVCKLGRSGLSVGETLDLAARIETARFHIRSLRLGRRGGVPFEQPPEWTKPMLWNGFELGD